MKPRAHLDALPPYVPIEPFEVLSARSGRAPAQIVKLDANENPYGPLPVVREALGRLEFPHIYPDPESRALRKSLADFTGVPAEFLLAGAGADELIDLLMRVLLEPGECVLTCPPTFGMYAFDAGLNVARLISVPRRDNFSLDLEAVRAAVESQQPKLIFLATPNNPDGSLLDAATIDALLELPALVVLDEAYIEFAGEHLGAGLSRIREVPSRRNLVVLRTFSKWAGLAGLRVGYGAFPGWLTPALWKAKQPYNLNVAASTAAQVSLAHADELEEVVARLRLERERLFTAMQEIPFLRPYPTRSNFILCRVIERDAAELKARLAQQHGIFVRYFDKPGLRDHIRISVGRPEDTDALFKALDAWYPHPPPYPEGRGDSFP
jgi:histidinol-phosphate aminotransferase